MGGVEGVEWGMSGRKETCSLAVFLRNVRRLDEQLSELQRLQNRVRTAEIRAIGRKRRYIAQLLTGTSTSTAAPITFH
jgi:hypothetical protein